MNSINRSNIDINVLMRGKEGEENIFSERNISKIDHIDICVLVQGREGEEAYHGHLQTNLTTGQNRRSDFIFLPAYIINVTELMLEYSPSCSM